MVCNHLLSRVGAWRGCWVHDWHACMAGHRRMGYQPHGLGWTYERELHQILKPVSEIRLLGGLYMWLYTITLQGLHHIRWYRKDKPGGLLCGLSPVQIGEVLSRGRADELEGTGHKGLYRTVL